MGKQIKKLLFIIMLPVVCAPSDAFSMNILNTLTNLGSKIAGKAPQCDANIIGRSALSFGVLGSALAIGHYSLEKFYKNNQSLTHPIVRQALLGVNTKIPLQALLLGASLGLMVCAARNIYELKANNDYILHENITIPTTQGGPRVDVHDTTPQSQVVVAITTDTSAALPIQTASSLSRPLVEIKNTTQPHGGTSAQITYYDPSFDDSHTTTQIISSLLTSPVTFSLIQPEKKRKKMIIAGLELAAALALPFFALTW